MNTAWVRGVIVVVTIASATVLAALGDLSEGTYVALATLLLGYVFGKATNGIEQLKMRMPDPATGRSDEPR